ncbi:MAG: alpha/beta hydrolase [Candidatus Marinimicrobia bacterium]|nr:alpha/beta hydrolase [Candidatus Neomarinimicrobiota bacterium]
MENLLKISLRILTYGVLFYVVYSGYYFFMQKRIIYPRHIIRTPPDIYDSVPGLERIWLNTKSGKVEAWYFQPSDSSEQLPFPAMIIAHGNAELIDYWLPIVNEIRELGMSVLLVEYPGYGRSEGEPGEESLTEAFIAAYDTLISKPEVDAGRIVLFGRSVGSGVICALADARPSAAMILMSPFSSISAMAADFYLPGFLVKDRFDNLSLIKSYDNPILFVHGSRDRIIPYKHSLKLLAASRQGKLITYDKGHNDLIEDWNLFWNEARPFLIRSKVLNEDE